jgi:hypothetical protein
VFDLTNLMELLIHVTYFVEQLLRIEEELGAAAIYAGAKFRAPVEPY